MKSTPPILAAGLCVITLLLFTTPATAQLSWALRAPLVDPRTRSGVEGASSNLIGNKIYVSHGYRFGDSALLSIYDIPSDTWTHGGSAAPNAFIPRSEMAGGTALGRHYAIGGRTGPNADNEEFDPTTSTWTAKKPMTIARGGLGAASWSDKIYAVGGRDGSTFGAGTIFGLNEAYNPATDTWTALAPVPIPVSDNYATVAFNGRVYILGGATAPATVISKVQIYDIATDTWSVGTDMPTARAAAMAGVISNRIAVFGGFDPMVGNLVVTELYDPLTDTWSPGPDMLEPVSEISQGVTYNGSEIYAIGTGIFGASGSVVQVLRGTICDIQLNKTSFVNGETVIAQVLRVANPTATPLAIEFKFWFEVPESTPISYARGGADGSVVLPVGFNQDLGPLTLFTVGSQFPRGTYAFNCRFLVPVTGRLQAEDLTPFEIR